MPDFAAQRTIPLAESQVGVARYTTAPGENIRVEMVTFATTWEPPLFAQAQVFYGAPAVGTLGYYSTPWILLDAAVVAGVGYFTFARGLTSVPDDVPRVPTPYTLPESIIDNNYFMTPLPDIALGDGWELGVVISGTDTAGAGVDLHVQDCVLTVTDLRDEETSGVIPPYTGLPFAEQVSPLPAGVA